MTVKKVITPKKKMVARVKCKGSLCNTNEKVILDGITDCVEAAKKRSEDDKSCSYGCLGYGTCAEKCPFDAIEMIDGLAVVIEDKCKGCKICVKACPNDVIEMIPAGQEVVVDCNSKDIGKVVREACKVGCISCKMCVKVCPFFAMDFTDNLAHINYDNCTNCILCAEKCPTKAITADAKPKAIADISEDKCIGCTLCAQVCPVNAIDGHREETHVVNKELCISCSFCSKKCPVDAITMVEIQTSDKPKVKPVKVVSYEKDVLKYYENFDDIKNISESIEYEETNGSEVYKGLLHFHRITKLESDNIFEVTYRGSLRAQVTN